MADDETNRDLSFLGEEADFQIRWVLHPTRNELFYSVTDIIAALLPHNPDPSSYWRQFKRTLKTRQGSSHAP